MRRFSFETDESILGDVKYRNNVVTGEVAVVNRNGTYDVYISGSDVAYPNIPTTVREPDFEVGEAVEILIEYGNKEMPIIIGHAKKVVQEFVEDEINVLVTTLGAYSITSASAYLELRIEEIEGYENCTRYGFYYGTTTDYGLPPVSSTGSFAAGSYNKQVTGLTANTTYHYQAYVHDAYNDVHTGDDKILKTSGYSLYEYYLATDANFNLRFGGDTWRGQVFLTTSAHVINCIELLLAKRYSYSLPGTVYVEIRATDETGYIPTGPILASGETNGNTLPDDGGTPDREWRKIDLTEYNLQDNTKYAITLHTTEEASANQAVFWNTGNNLYTDGTAISSFDIGVNWSKSVGNDGGFKIYGK